MKYLPKMVGMTMMMFAVVAVQGQTGNGSGSYTESGYTINVAPAKYSKMVTYPIFGPIATTQTGGSYFSATATSSNGAGILTISGNIGGPGATETFSAEVEPTYELAVSITPPSGVTASGTKTVTVSYSWEQYQDYSYTIQASSLIGGGTWLQLDTALTPTSLYSLQNFSDPPITPASIIGGYFVPVNPTTTGGSAAQGWGYISSTQTLTVTCTANPSTNTWTGNSGTFTIPTGGYIPNYVGAYCTTTSPTSTSIQNEVVPSPTGASF